MTFYAKLQQETMPDRDCVWQAPIIQRSLAGAVELDEYVAFLQQAYHHVKHTVPLLMACGSRLTTRQEWLREAVTEYIAEESGHQEWVLNDIAACGYDKEAARNSQPNMATELMVSYAYDSIQRVSPLTLFGMVHVLEGSSIAMADQAAGSMAKALGLQQSAFTYLTSHGALDVEHVEFFKRLMNRITDPTEQALIVHSARVFYHLYGNVFRELNTRHGLAKAA